MRWLVCFHRRHLGQQSKSSLPVNAILSKKAKRIDHRPYPQLFFSKRHVHCGNDNRMHTDPENPKPMDDVGTLCDLGLDHHSNKTSHVLIVGDGNFSFTRAFARHNRSHMQLLEATKQPTLSVTATSLDIRDELLTMYPNATEILDELKVSGVRVIHDVNATKLETYDFLPSRFFDRIVFNFPHFAEGGNKRNKINRHRQLLREFLTSAHHALAPNGQVWITLCAGQGGTPLEKKVRSWGDTWQIMHCAASAQMLLANVHVCPVERLAALGYYSVGYRLREKAFFTSDSLTHVFRRESDGIDAFYPLEWTRDISFWINEAEFEDAKLLDMLKQHFPATVTLSIAKFDEYRSPTTKRLALGYHVYISSRRVALSQEYVHERMVAALQAVEASSFASSRAT